MKKEHFILIFHGSSKIENKDSLIELENSLSKYLDNFSICYLKSSSPSFEEILEKTYKNGNKRIKCLPLFLLSGSHVLNDIPNIIFKFKQKHTDTEINLLPCLVKSKFFPRFVYDTLKNV